MEGDGSISHKPGTEQMVSPGSSSKDQADAIQIGIDLVHEPNPTSIHFFVDVESYDKKSYREATNMDPDSIITFLTLPTITARIESKKKDLVINFSKSLILRLEQYIAAV